MFAIIAMLWSAFGTIGPGDDLDPTLPIMTAFIERYRADLGSLERFDDAPLSVGAHERRAEFLRAWLDRLDAVDVDDLDVDGRVDVVLLRHHLEFRIDQEQDEIRRLAEIEPLAPFVDELVSMLESHRRMHALDPRGTAMVLDRLASEIAEATSNLEEASSERDRILARRASIGLDRLRRALDDWHGFHDGYDPLFSWWCDAPWEACRASLREHARALREDIAGIRPGVDPVIGDPAGREMLIRMLEHEMIPYTPEELVEIAEREYAWCLNEMKRASNELGFGDDWHGAMDHVKNLHVAPGEQPALITDLAVEAIEFLESRDLVTIPPLCATSWRMEMMSPERQKVSPYFLGGETIIVSFPTDTMEHADKLMSMRGNNEHFARATVHHELIPGHHLQGYMTKRYRTHRSLFRTPFWIEGWALYWEMRLWDLEFARGPEDRVGMLFWRMHRCARIIFSLRFHLGEMTAYEAIDFLVENVGHERNNATAEVRRSVSGDYPPLYQAAYMLGGLQIRALHRELVVEGDMGEKAFHDAILRHNAIPIEMVRAALKGVELEPDYSSSWRFDD